MKQSKCIMSPFKHYSVRPTGNGHKVTLLEMIESSKIYGFHSSNLMYDKLYRQIQNVKALGYRRHRDPFHGAIFNLEFSVDGKAVVAACENRCLLLYDPATHKQIHQITAAHEDCVNCIHFVNHRTFTTGSDDKTIKLWDLRKMDRSIGTLRGHRGWVKNIGHDRKTGLLVSSSFDQTVKLWDLDNISDSDEVSSETIINADRLLRSKLSNSCSKLFLAMTDKAGIIAIHDVDLLALKNCCLDMKTAQQSSNARRRPHNRIEIINDFSVDMWCIYSIDVHPYDWCIVSRYLSKDGKEEHLAVHDVQDSHLGGCSEECNHALSRMTHYIKESTSASGFIKEVCFSPDGKLISSPYHNGVRLLAFDQCCTELSHCVPSKAVPLNVVNTIMCHKRSVLTSTFSPFLPLLVTGCRAGEVLFHHPLF